MMRMILLVLIIFSFSSIYSQNKLDLNVGYGYYLSNSENSFKIIGDENFSSYLFYGFAYQRENLLGINFRFEYNYHQINKENVISFYSFSHGEYSWTGDLSIISHNIDINYFGNFSKYLFYGIGPSFVITNRILEIRQVQPVHENNNIYDKLAASGLGINGYLSVQIPLTNDKNYFYFTSMLKLRYTYSIWYDEGIRELDDYYQEYFTTQLSIGVGYSF